MSYRCCLLLVMCCSFVVARCVLLAVCRGCDDMCVLLVATCVSFCRLLFGFSVRCFVGRDVMLGSCH